MLLSVLLAVLNGPPVPESGTCTVEGQVTLVRDGKPVPTGAGRVVVYLDEKVRRAKGGSITHTMEQKDRQFVPNVLVVQKDDVIEFVNRDKVEHNVFSLSPWFDMKRSRQDVTGKHPFNIVQPVRVNCDLHSFMRADVLVLEHRLFATVDATGHYRISGLPTGDRVLRVWEPNGTTVGFTLKQCTGVVRAPDLTVPEGPPPPPVSISGAPTDGEIY